MDSDSAAGTGRVRCRFIGKLPQNLLLMPNIVYILI